MNQEIKIRQVEPVFKLHEGILGDDLEFEPGEVRDIYVRSRNLFRAKEARPVDGVDYDSFVIEHILVGQQAQWPSDFTRPAKALFRGLRADAGLTELGVCTSYTPITFRVRNTSDRRQLFKICLAGEMWI